MREAIIKYYFDLTRYNLGCSIIIAFITRKPFAGIVTFGTFGMLGGILCYKYFQKNQYYFYYHLGLKKTKLISITWTINLFFAAVLLWIFR